MHLSAPTSLGLQHPAQAPTFDVSGFQGSMPGLATLSVVVDADDAPKKVQTFTIMVTHRGSLWSVKSLTGRRLGVSFLGPFEACRMAIEAILMEEALSRHMSMQSHH
jgi:hypothetical protein